MLISYLAKIHNGFWFWKYCFLAGLLILYFYIINIEEIDEFRESLKTFSHNSYENYSLIDVGDRCWRRNMLVTATRYW